MQEQNKSVYALLAVFPTVKNFVDFVDNSENFKHVQSFLSYAVRYHIIDAPKEELLTDFIAANSRNLEEFSPPDNLDFEGLLKKKSNLLNIENSLRGLTEQINTLISKYRIDLPKVTNSMLTRLKKEPADTLHKCNVLRSLAFWIGHERPDISLSWNYESLLKLCSESKQAVNYKEGVRIAFALYGRGDVIDHDIVGWLKKELQDYIETFVQHFLYGRWGRVRSHDLTTLYVDFPKEIDFSDPASYHRCIRSAISLSHQVCIHWALSEYFSPNRFLSIGIAAGYYAALDNHLLPLLNARLPGDPVIRVTSFTRQCLLINDIRVILCGKPHEIMLFNGETLPIWWVEGFWSTVYFDFVTDLLKDEILQTKPESVEKLTFLLSLTSQKKISGATEDNAVSKFLKSPHNSMLGIEIVKVLYYRRRFWEAIDILRVILSIDPFHLNARTIRMMIFRNLALNAPTFSIGQDLFLQAEQEAVFIQQYCFFQSEDYFCEYSVNNIARALMIIKYLRRNHGQVSRPNTSEELIKTVFAQLDMAEEKLKKGLAISPTGIRSVYLMNSVKVLKAVLEDDPKLFITPEKPLDGRAEIVRQQSMSVQWQIGMLRKNVFSNDKYDFVEQSFQNNFEIHGNSILLSAYRPSIYFSRAVTMWDFFPKRTIASIKSSLRLLEEAIRLAARLEKDGIGIYSYTQMCGEIMPGSKFIEHIDNTIRTIMEVVGDVSQRDNREVITPDPKRSCLLMTLNI